MKEYELKTSNTWQLLVLILVLCAISIGTVVAAMVFSTAISNLPNWILGIFFILAIFIPVFLGLKKGIAIHKIILSDEGIHISEIKSAWLVPKINGRYAWNDIQYFSINKDNEGVILELKLQQLPQPLSFGKPEWEKDKGTMQEFMLEWQNYIDAHNNATDSDINRTKIVQKQGFYETKSAQLLAVFMIFLMLTAPSALAHTHLSRPSILRIALFYIFALPFVVRVFGWKNRDENTN